jgi:AraC-like DNA-binding protein
MSEVWRRSPDPDFGLHAGESYGYVMDTLQVILFNSATVGDALSNLGRYGNLCHDILRPVLSVQEDTAVLALEGDASQVLDYRNFVETHLSYHYSLICRLAGEKINLDSVHFVHPAPANTTEHEHIFGVPILFNQKESKLVFNKRYLDIPIQVANPELLRSIEQHAQRLQEEIYRPDTFSARVERSIMKAFSTGRTDIDAVSKHLAMSKRSLQNRLKDEGTKYQDLLDGVKKKQAQYFLGQTDMSIVHIAFFLGYSEQSAFNRAFKKWTGCTPREYRLGRGDLE